MHRCCLQSSWENRVGLSVLRGGKAPGLFPGRVSLRLFPASGDLTIGHMHTYKQYTYAQTTQTTYTYTLLSWAQGVCETAGYGAGGLETLRRVWSRAVPGLQLERTTPSPKESTHHRKHCKQTY